LEINVQKIFEKSRPKTFYKITVKKYLKNNGQYIFETNGQNNGRKIFEKSQTKNFYKITVKKYLKNHDQKLFIK